VLVGVTLVQISGSRRRVPVAEPGSG